MKYIYFISLLFSSTSCPLHVMNTSAQMHMYQSGIVGLVTPMESEAKK